MIIVSSPTHTALGSSLLGEKVAHCQIPSKRSERKLERVHLWNLPSENEAQMNETQAQGNYVTLHIIILSVCPVCITFRQLMACKILGLCVL